jgi:predicted nucleotidyltransferase
MKEHLKYLLQKFFMNQPVHRAYLFSSAARNEEFGGSDINILVEQDSEKGASYFSIYNMQQQLNKPLNQKSGPGKCQRAVTIYTSDYRQGKKTCL